ncbi:hypothetical protein [Agaribacter flavus]|uniref:Uncharacterized protein n=1 Tax=Agaribacter flavus TaxID=1902781 RepID=A0ABV7FS03_9ALTE
MGRLVVVYNKSIDTLDVGDVHTYFSLRKQLLPSGKKVNLVTLPLDSPDTTRFTQAIFDFFPYQLARVWDARVFAGKGTLPDEVYDHDTLIAFILGNKTGLGYLVMKESDIKELSEQVNVLLIEE